MRVGGREGEERSGEEGGREGKRESGRSGRGRGEWRGEGGGEGDREREKWQKRRAGEEQMAKEREGDVCMCSCAGSRTLAIKACCFALTMGPKRVRARLDCPRGPEWWVSGKHGSLSPWTQAKAFALVTASRQRSLDLSDND